MSNPLDVLVRKQFALPNTDPVSPERAVTEIIAPGATLADNPTTKRTELRLGSASGWTNFTPTFSASGGGFSLGNGSAAGRFQTVGSDRRVELFLNIGSTTALGTGNLTLPIAASSPPAIATGTLLTVPGIGSQGVRVQVYFMGGSAAEDAAGFVAMAHISGGNVVLEITSITANYSASNGETIGFYFEVPLS